MVPDWKWLHARTRRVFQQATSTHIHLYDCYMPTSRPKETRDRAIYGLREKSRRTRAKEKIERRDSWDVSPAGEALNGIRHIFAAGPDLVCCSPSPSHFLTPFSNVNSGFCVCVLLAGLRSISSLLHCSSYRVYIIFFLSSPFSFFYFSPSPNSSQHIIIQIPRFTSFDLSGDSYQHLLTRTIDISRFPHSFIPPILPLHPTTLSTSRQHFSIIC